MKLLKINKNGFTLVESIISIAIVLLAAAAVLPLILYSSKSTFNNQKIMTANSLATSVLEEVRALDYESIGTIGGNPEGPLEQKQTRTLNGFDYTIYTTISWATAENDGISNPVAYKNIRIIVQGLNKYSNTEDVLAELHSIAARDGEEPLIEEGHLKVTIKDTNNLPVKNPYILVSIDGPEKSTNYIDSSGKAFFGMLKQGKYNITVKIPDNMFGFGGDIYDPISNSIIKNEVSVDNYATKEVTFYVDYKDNAGGMELQFVNSRNNETITDNGKISFNIKFGPLYYKIEKQFTTSDFIDGALPTEYFGILPMGAEITDIEVTDIPDYNNYIMESDSDKSLKTADGKTWSGLISGQDTVERVLIPLVPINRSYFYEESTKEDFKNFYLMHELFVHDEGRLTLKAYGPIVNRDELTVVANSEHNNEKKSIESVFDGNLDTYWQINNHKDDNFIEIVFNRTKVLKELTIFSNKNHGPKDYKIEFFIEGNDEIITIEGDLLGDWGDKGSSKTISLKDPISCDRLKLTFNIDNSSFPIHEMELIVVEEYAPNGYRIVGPLDFKGYETVTNFKVYWEAKIPEVTSLEIGALILDEGKEPKESDFKDDCIIENSGDTIPNISWGESLSGKRLWLIERFTSNEDRSATPEITRLYIDAD